jgi:hypothetical protein
MIPRRERMSVAAPVSKCATPNPRMSEMNTERYEKLSMLGP